MYDLSVSSVLRAHKVNADNQVGKGREDLHEGNKEVSYHVQFRKSVLGNSSRVLNLAPSLVERERVHDC